MNLIPTADVPAVQDILEFDRTAFLMNPSKRERSQEEYDDWKRVWVNRSGAWALVHLLKNGPKTHRIRFDQYLTMLGEGKDDSRGAWLTLASAEEQNKLQSDFRAWLNRPGREITVLRTPYEPPAPAMEHARVMSPSDVHLVWSLVRDGHEMSEANAAIQLDPESSRARALRGRLHQKLAEDTEAETDFEAALSLSPDDVRYQVALFRFYAERATPRRAPPHFRQRADALVPKLLGRVRSVTAKDALARYLAITGRNEQALPLALEAVEADPSCWQCYDTLALLVAMQGDMAKAAEVQSLAVNLMPHGVTEESVIQRLRMYEGGAAGPAAGGPSTTGGDLSSDVVAKVLKLRRGAFRQCMSRSRNQTLDSKVVIRFVIDKDGSIFTASAEESTVQDDVIECLLDVVSSMRFPAPADGEQVTVRYPLSFKPPAQPAPAQPVAAP